MKSEIRKRKGLKHYGGESENIIINCWKCPEEGQAAGGRGQGPGGRGRGGAGGRGAHQIFIRGRLAARYCPLRFAYYL